MSKLISIDPGITTGVALFENGAFVRSFVLEEGCYELLDEIEYDFAVIEQPPTLGINRIDNRLRAVFAEIRSIFPLASLVKPGVWKTSYWGRVKTDLPTTHQRDAYRLGLYAINVLIGE